jgi:hypothetical protein
VQRIASFPRVRVSADGRGVCSHVGSRLLAEVAAAAGVGESLEEVVGARRQRRSAHAPGRVLADLAVMLADGGVAIGDLGYCVTSRTCSGRWPPRRQRGGCWTGLTNRYSIR